MEIAVLGSGNVGKALASSFIRAGHRVTLTASTPTTPAPSPARPAARPPIPISRPQPAPKSWSWPCSTRPSTRSWPKPATP
jgi:nucleoside-diphosphate-sugar epimerase